MGSKYTTLSASGYNSSPPSDDGTQAASNLVTWSKHKTKLGDPVKNLADAMNTALVTAMDYSVRQISSSDSTVAGDHMKCVEIAPTVTASVTVSLGDASTMTSIYRVFVKNSSAKNQTLGRATVGDTIDGSASNITLPPGAGVVLQTTTGANGYLITAWYGPKLDTDPIAVGSSDGTKKVRLEVDGLTAATTRVITVADRDIAIGKYPTRQTFTTGSGTYTTPTGCIYIRVRMVGAGGGGSGNAAGAGTAGGDTTFSSLTSSGGAAGNALAGGAGGATSGGDFGFPGGTGGGGGQTATANTFLQGGHGGNSFFGGGGAQGVGNGNGGNGATNTGSGGGGGGGASAGNSGGGGGAGGYVDKVITSPAATYSYGVGAGGAGSTGTASTGGTGAAGLIVVDEFYA